MHSAVDELAAVSMVDVVGLGLNAFDTIVVVPRFPAAGEKVRIVEAVRCPGGQVATAILRAVAGVSGLATSAALVMTRPDACISRSSRRPESRRICW